VVEVGFEEVLIKKKQSQKSLFHITKQAVANEHEIRHNMFKLKSSGVTHKSCDILLMNPTLAEACAFSPQMILASVVILCLG
jgi:hypothetical protein